MQTDDPDENQIVSLITRGIDPHSDDWRRVSRFVLTDDPHVAWDRLTRVLDAAPSDSEIASIAAYIAEPLLQENWRTLLDRLLPVLRSQRVRQLMHGVMLSDLPEDVEAQIDEAISARE